MMTQTPFDVGPLSRRGFLASLASGSLILASRASGAAMIARLTDADDSALPWEPDLFVAIAPDGTVSILAHRSEMGTGIRTALPMVVADELGADWGRVAIRQAIGDKRLGSQNTDGSKSVRQFFERMRVAGATARTMLTRAAAAQWQVDPSECSAARHHIVCTATGRKLGFGELVAAASALDVPDPDSLSFRSQKDWTIVGRDIPLTDMNELLTGKAVFGIDVRRAGQLFAVIERPPVLGGKVDTYDQDAARAVPGVVDVIEIPKFEGPVPVYNPLGGVAVLANSTWAAIQGRKALNATWTDGDHASFDSTAYEVELGQSARKPGKAFRKVGDVSAAFSDAPAAQVFEADYYVPMLAHASMEPPCAVAEVTSDSDGQVVSCEAWAPTQNPQAAQSQVAQTLGIDEAKVTINVTLLGGGFGRKSKPDYVAEAALLSREVGKPVHVTWTREDDIRHDFYHAVAALHMRAAVDEKGKPTAWLQRSAFPSIGSTFNPAATSGGAGEMGMGFTDLPFDIPNIVVENGPAKGHVRIGWLRSVANIYHAFGIGSFADELAHRAGRDPYEYLMELLGAPRQVQIEGYGNYGETLERYPLDIGRLRHVTERAAKLANWGRKLPRGSGLGIACHRSFLSYCANVVEVKVEKDGTVSMPMMSVVIDAGTIIHPDRVRAQMEGAATFGASLTMHGEITARNGRIEQGNFDTYPMAKIYETPRDIKVEVVKSTALPAGVGEVGVPPFAPALCNAIFAATGKRIRRLPLAKHDLSWT